MDFLNSFLDSYFQNVSDWSLDGGDYYIATGPINSLMVSIGISSGLIAAMGAFMVVMKSSAGRLGDISARRIIVFSALVLNSFILHFVYNVSIMASSMFYNVDDYAKESIARECGTWYIASNIIPLLLFVGLAFVLKKLGDQRLFTVLRSKNKILGII